MPCVGHDEDIWRSRLRRLIRDVASRVIKHVAPTALKLTNIAPPGEMTGRALVDFTTL
jgi:hypothetical protein